MRSYCRWRPSAWVLPTPPQICGWWIMISQIFLRSIDHCTRSRGSRVTRRDHGLFGLATVHLTPNPERGFSTWLRGLRGEDNEPAGPPQPDMAARNHRCATFLPSHQSRRSQQRCRAVSCLQNTKLPPASTRSQFLSFIIASRVHVDVGNVQVKPGRYFSISSLVEYMLPLLHLH